MSQDHSTIQGGKSLASQLRDAYEQTENMLLKQNSAGVSLQVVEKPGPLVKPEDVHSYFKPYSVNTLV